MASTAFEKGIHERERAFFFFEESNFEFFEQKIESNSNF
jgi:hypothetical protein